MWAQVINAILGIYLMSCPDYFGYGMKAAASNNDHIVGPVIATFAITAIWEACRNARWFNIPVAFWLLLAPWVLGYDNTTAIINDMVVGVIVLALSFVKGHVSQRFGGGWRAIWKRDAPHNLEAKEAALTRPRSM